MKEEKIYCDIKNCKNEIPNVKNYTKKQLDIIFTTEQTEGRPTKPYLTRENLDLCDNCYEKVLRENYIYGSGAQGYNEYKFWEK